MWVASAVGIVGAGLVGVVAEPAAAFKPSTHMTATEVAVADIDKASLTTRVAGQPLKLDQESVLAVTRNMGTYMAGVSGPDAYPDMLFGQSIIHPSSSQKWIDLLWTEAHKLPDTTPEEKTLREQAIAFTLGFVAHASGDLWGHAFANKFSGGAFPEMSPSGPPEKLISNGLIAAKHIVLETYVDSFRVGLARTEDKEIPYTSPIKKYVDAGLNLGSPGTQVPTTWLTNVLIGSDLGREAINSGAAKLIDGIKNCPDRPCLLPPTDDSETSFAASASSQRQAVQKLLADYSDIGTMTINKVFYAAAPEFDPSTAPTAPAELFAEQQSRFFFGYLCRLGLGEKTCDSLEAAWKVGDTLADFLGRISEEIKQLIKPLVDMITALAEDAVNDGIATANQALSANVDSISDPAVKQLATTQLDAIRAWLDVDGDGRITVKDLKKLSFSAPALVMNAKCPELSEGSLAEKACFDGDEINRLLGVENPLIKQGDQNFSPESFAAFGDAVNLIKMSFASQGELNKMYKKMGLKSADSLFPQGQSTVLNPWLTILDGTDKVTDFGGYRWKLWTNCTAREKVFTKLFREPYPGFFSDTADSCKAPIVPGVPQNVTAVKSQKQRVLIVSWNPPTNVDDADVLEYEVTVTDPASSPRESKCAVGSDTMTTCVIKNADLTDASRVSVSATYEKGSGPASDPVAPLAGFSLKSNLTGFGKTPLCLSASTGSSGAETRPCSTDAARQTLTRDGDQLKMSSQCLRIDGAASSGSGVAFGACDGNAGSRWSGPSGAGSAVRNPESGLCLAVRNDTAKSLVPIVVSSCSDVDGQKWTQG